MLLGIGRERVQRSFPEFPILIEPGFDGAEGLGTEDAMVNTTVDVSDDEPRILEHLQVSGDGGKRDRERRGELRDGLGASSEAGEDASARRVPESTKYDIEPSLNRRARSSARATSGSAG